MMELQRDQIWDSDHSKWKHRKFQRNLFLEKIKTLKGKILEIGPGYGRVMLEFQSKMDFNIIGLEISERLSELLAQKKLNVVQGNCLNMPFAENTFDSVICEEVIEHIEDQDKMLAETKRVLKTGGYIIFVTPNKYTYRLMMYLSNIINRKLSISLLKNPTPGHIAELTYYQFANKISNYFEIIDNIPINAFLREQFLRKYPFLSIDVMIIAKKNN
jgi:ubiquinone/menaquinone biosynthesis C-methylase UbiE